MALEAGGLAQFYAKVAITKYLITHIYNEIQTSGWNSVMKEADLRTKLYWQIGRWWRCLGFS